MDIYNKRALKILELFMNSKKELNGESIALVVGVTSRTVRNDIREINSFIKKYDAEIISQIGLGYNLKINNIEKFEQLKRELDLNARNISFNDSVVPSEPEDRIKYIISKLLLNSLNGSKNIDLFDLADELFIGTTTLKKDLKSVEKIVQKFALKLVISQKNGIYISGNEAKLRYCISEIIFNQNNLITIEGLNIYEDIFKNEEVNKIKEFLLNAITHYNIRITDIAFKNLLIHIVIMLKRVKNDKKMDYDETDIKILENSIEFKCAKEILEKVKVLLNLEFGKEIYYLTQHLVSSKKFSIEDLENDYECKNAVELILNRIKQDTNINLSDDHNLINGLAIHLSVAINRIRFEMNIRNEFLDSMKNSYPLAFELAVIASEVIDKIYQIKTNENEIGFLAIHFGAALERMGLNEKEEIKSAIIVCAFGVATTMLLKEKIRKNFGHKIKVVKTCPLYELNLEMIESVDLILTTVPIEKFNSDKIKKINILLNNDDLYNLGKIINKTEKMNSDIDYSNIFRKDLFFANVRAEKKEDVLEKITNIMIEKKYITENIKKSIYKREEMATTELGSLVAIPHALLNDMKEALVAVAILEKPIIWEAEKVQIVLLISIPKSKYEIWERVFRNLYEYLIDSYGANKLIKHCNYQNFISDLNSQEKMSYVKARRKE